MRYIVFFFIVGCIGTYVLLDSQTLEFEKKTVERTETVERISSAPVFRWDRLARYFEKLISKIGK
jgi:hypothetical protein